MLFFRIFIFIALHADQYLQDDVVALMINPKIRIIIINLNKKEQSMSHIDKIRKRIEQHRQTITNQHSPINQMFFSTFLENYQRCDRTDYNLRNEKCDTLPIITKMSASVRTNSDVNYQNKLFWRAKPIQNKHVKQEKKMQIISLNDSSIKRKRFSLEPAKINRQIIEKSLPPSIRISQTRSTVRQRTYETERNQQIDQIAPFTVIIISTPEIRLQKPKLTVNTSKKHTKYFVKKTKSPKKRMSPIRKSSISAWQTSDDIQE